MHASPTGPAVTSDVIGEGDHLDYNFMYVLYKLDLKPKHDLDFRFRIPFYLPRCGYEALDPFDVRASLPLRIALPRHLWEEPCNPHSDGSDSDQHPIYQGPICDLRVLIGECE